MVVARTGRVNEESTSASEGSGTMLLLPVPPPLPVHLNIRFDRKGAFMTGSKVRGYCCASRTMNCSMDRLFDEGYRADVSISTDDGGVIYAHANILGNASPVFKEMLKQQKGHGRRGKVLRSISILGVQPEAARVFIRFLYSSCYEEERMKELALPLLVLSHAYVVPQLKKVCECWLEQGLTPENAVDIFQISLLCDAGRLGFICHRFILKNLKSVSATEGWKAMKESHPVLEKEIHSSVMDEEFRRDERRKKENERKMYIQLHDAMEALVHFCRDGCRTVGPKDRILVERKEPCEFEACKGLEALVRHFAGCKMRGPGGCVHCKRMWQILELHSRLCANSDACGVPLCRNLRQRRRKQKKKEDMRWRILVKKIVRSKSITGAPFFVLESS